MRFLRFLGRLFVVLIGVAIILAVVSLFLPREVTVTRSIRVDASPDKVFPHIDSLQQAQQWSPWSGIDPEMTVSFSGPRRRKREIGEWSSCQRPTIKVVIAMANKVWRSPGMNWKKPVCRCGRGVIDRTRSASAPP